MTMKGLIKYYHLNMNDIFLHKIMAFVFLISNLSVGGSYVVIGLPSGRPITTYKQKKINPNNGRNSFTASYFREHKKMF